MRLSPAASEVKKLNSQQGGSDHLLRFERPDILQEGGVLGGDFCVPGQLLLRLIPQARALQQRLQKPAREGSATMANIQHSKARSMQGHAHMEQRIRRGGRTRRWRRLPTWPPTTSSDSEKTQAIRKSARERSGDCAMDHKLRTARQSARRTRMSSSPVLTHLIS